MSMRPLPCQTRSFGAATLLSVYAGFCAASPALAAEAIGNATEINRSVTGAVSGRPYSMSVGDPVKRDEIVRTDASGEARLQFVDRTNLVIFSSSSIRLNRFSPSRIIMTTSDGTFAFNTGNSPSGSYHINTPAGTLIPHSRFTFTVQGGRIKLDVQEGEVTFCPGGKSSASCVEATPGHPVVGQAGAPAQIEGGGPSPPPSPPPVYRQPINYSGPSGCSARSAVDLRYGCPTGASPPRYQSPPGDRRVTPINYRPSGCTTAYGCPTRADGSDPAKIGRPQKQPVETGFNSGLAGGRFYNHPYYPSSGLGQRFVRLGYRR